MASLRFWNRTPERPDTEQRLADLSGFIGPQYAAFADAYGSVGSDPNQAVQTVVALFACVSLLADTIGSLPLHLYSRGAEGRDRVDYSTALQNMTGRGYPGSLARLIGLVPNPDMTAQELWTFVVGSCALWGNAYVEVIRTMGRPTELWPLRPDRMRVTRDGNGDLAYMYRLSLEKPELRIPEVLHIRAFGTDGVMGLSPISVARTTLKATKAAEEFSGRWYANGARPSAVFTMPPGQDNDKDKYRERVKLYREGLDANYGGPSNAGRVVVLQNGSDWKTLSMPMSDMQFVETLHWNVEQWASLYRVPGYMIGRTEPGEVSYASVEQRNLHFLTYTLRPILARIEGAICRGLGLDPGVKTLEDETPALYAEFLTADLLRTDLKTRYEAYAIGIQSRFLSPSTVANFENLPFDSSRPADYENPNTKAAAPPPPQAPAQDPTVQQNAALISALTARALERPQQTSFPMTVEAHAHFPEGAMQVENRFEVLSPDPTPVSVTVEPPQVTVENRVETPAPVVNVTTPKVKRRVIRDKDGNMTGVEDE